MGKAEIAAAARSGGWGTLHLKPATESWSTAQSWPVEIKGDMAWEPEDLASGNPYVLALTVDDVSELRASMDHFSGTAAALLSRRLP